MSKSNTRDIYGSCGRKCRTTSNCPPSLVDILQGVLDGPRTTMNEVELI